MIDAAQEFQDSFFEAVLPAALLGLATDRETALDKVGLGFALSVSWVT